MGSIVLLYVVVCAFSAGRLWVDACMCALEHPQQDFCDADFVIRAKVLDIELIREPGYYMPTGTIYTINITKVYKEVAAYNDAIKTVLKTGGSGGDCKLNLSNGTDYVITGRLNGMDLTTTMCDWYSEFASLTDLQRRGVAYKYRMNCGCKINRCVNGHCSGLDENPAINEVDAGPDVFNNMCIWDGVPNDCYYQHSYCVSNSNQDTCRWKFNRRFRRCMTSTAT